MKNPLIAFTIAASFGSAQADALQDYRGGTMIRVLKCKSALLTARIGASLGKSADRNFSQCLEAGDKEVRELYGKAEKLVAKKPSATAALKPHLVKVVAALKGMDANDADARQWRVQIQPYVVGQGLQRRDIDNGGFIDQPTRLQPLAHQCVERGHESRQRFARPSRRGHQRVAPGLNGRPRGYPRLRGCRESAAESGGYSRMEAF